MILEDYEKTNYATEDHSLVKFLVGDSTEKIPISYITLEKDEWTDGFAANFMSYTSLELEKQLVNSLQETFDREIIEALSKKLIK